MKKISILGITIISVISLILLIFYGLNKYSKYERSKKCMETTEESMINSCLEHNDFFNNEKIAESIQLTYDFYNKNYLYDFKDKKINSSFINFYETAFLECRNLNGCDLRDDGKGYYKALNKCFLNESCTNLFIDRKSLDCISDFEKKIKKLPENVKKLITIDKEYFCKIYENQKY